MALNLPTGIVKESSEQIYRNSLAKHHLFSSEQCNVDFIFDIVKFVRLLSVEATVVSHYGDIRMVTL